MKFQPNPFLQNTSPEEISLPPRKLSKLFSPITTEGGALAVRGERGMGKTLMLQYIANPPADLRQQYFANYIFLFSNCPDTVIPPTEENCWFQAIKHLHRKLDSSRMKDKCQVLLEKKKQGTELSNHDFHDILDLGAEEGKRIVLVLDDFDVLIKTDAEHFTSTRCLLSR